jgi:hypothetical protein
MCFNTKFRHTYCFIVALLSNSMSTKAGVIKSVSETGAECGARAN